MVPYHPSAEYMTPDADIDLVLLDGATPGTTAGDPGKERPIRVVVSDRAGPTAFVRLDPDDPEDERKAAVLRASRLGEAPDSATAAALGVTVRSVHVMDSKVRHDIANQLMVLSGYLELLEELVPEGEAREFLDGSLRAAELVNRHLTFSRSYREFGLAPPAWHDLASLLPSGVELPVEAAGVQVWADPLAPVALTALFGARGGPAVGWRASIEPGPDGGLLVVLDDDGPALSERDVRLFFDYRQGEGQAGEPFLARHVLGATGISLEAAASPDGGLQLRMAVPEGSSLGCPGR